MKISLFAIVFVSIFAFSMGEVKAEGLEEVTSEKAAARHGLRGVTVTEEERNLKDKNTKDKDSEDIDSGEGAGRITDPMGTPFVPVPIPQTSFTSVPAPAPIPSFPATTAPAPIPGFPVNTTATNNVITFPLATVRPTTTASSCTGGSVYWNAAQFPFWANARRCTTSLECGNLGCCLANFCFCTQQSFSIQQQQCV
jgi:hypothetical protein